MGLAVHYNQAVPWQAKRIGDFSQGLKALGIEHDITESRTRIADVSILFGTTFWRSIESDEGDWLLVDRASVGDPDFVQLVWNGHGRRGDHRVPPWADESRWEALGRELWPPLMGYQHIVLCGQTEPYSPHWSRLDEWYATVTEATHFRPHPAGTNPTALPVKTDWTDAKFHVLNSSVAVEAVIRGRPVEVHDEGCMAYGIEDREEWAHLLAWTQWNWEEIRAGRPVGHLF
jgi:hypothetical protein